MTMLAKSVKDVDLSKFSKVKKLSNDVLKKIYNHFEGDVLESNIEKDFLASNIFVDNAHIQQNYKDCLNGHAFSMAASKIHQYFTKQSLKLKQTVVEAGKYKIEANFGNKLLFSVELQCKNKNIAKNLAGLKYIEIYCYPVFKILYEKIIGEDCPEPDYITRILKSEKSRKELREQKHTDLDEELDSLNGSMSDSLGVNSEADDDIAGEIMAQDETFLTTASDSFYMNDHDNYSAPNNHNDVKPTPTMGSQNQSMKSSLQLKFKKDDFHPEQLMDFDTQSKKGKPVLEKFKQTDDKFSLESTNEGVDSSNKIQSVGLDKIVGQARNQVYQEDDLDSTLISSQDTLIKSSPKSESDKNQRDLMQMEIMNETKDSIDVGFQKTDESFAQSHPDLSFNYEKNHDNTTDMSFSSQISSISDGNLFKKKTHDSKQKTLFTSTNLNQLTIIKEQSNEFSSKELDQNNSVNSDTLSLISTQSSNKNNNSSSNKNQTHLLENQVKPTKPISDFNQKDNRIYDDDDLNKLMDNTSETDEEEEGNGQSNQRGEDVNKQLISLALEQYSGLYDLLRASKYKFIIKTITRTKDNMISWCEVDKNLLDNLISENQFNMINLKKLLAQVCSIEDLNIKLISPNELPAQSGKGFPVKIKIQLKYYGENYVHSIDYEGICKTTQASKLQEIEKYDACMFLLKETAINYFHRLQINLIKEQIFGKVGSNVSNDSSRYSEPKSSNSSLISQANHIPANMNVSLEINLSYLFLKLK